MITIQKLRYKNFMSVGDEFIEVTLDTHPTTLITGKNGSGKSLVIEALSFALFGKPYRDINKPQLVNTINSGGTIVEVEFRTGNRDYRIVRGIKPNLFEVYEDSELLPQHASVRDYQEMLEKSILRLNHKSFHQIVVLGSASFIPFMELVPQARREVIDDLLDTKVFSEMSIIAKKRYSEVKGELTKVDSRLSTLSELIRVKEEHLRQISADHAKTIRAKQHQMDRERKSIVLLTQENETLSNQLTDAESKILSAQKAAENKKDDINDFLSQFRSQVHGLESQNQFFESHETCPTCTQAIDSEIKTTILGKNTERLKELQAALQHGQVEVGRIAKEIAGYQDRIDQFNQVRTKIAENVRDINNANRTISQLVSETEELQRQKDDHGSKQDLQGYTDEQIQIRKARDALYEEKQYLEYSIEMLKDSGIKTKVITKYLEIINALVNQYLKEFEFFGSFHLDANFNETIKSRHRDQFSYASFSEGEKERIDLALLLTWRQIARMRNTITTNLLIMDEVGDSSLDSDGIEVFMTLLESVEKDSNVFVISHRGEHLETRFSRRIKVEKVKEFTQVIEESDSMAVLNMPSRTTTTLDAD